MKPPRRHYARDKVGSFGGLRLHFQLRPNTASLCNPHAFLAVAIPFRFVREETMLSRVPVLLHGTELLGDFAGRVSLGAFHIISGSHVFDLVHLLAHRSHASRIRILQCLARAHACHHQYFDRNLRFNDAFRMQNLLWHLPLELLCQLVGSTLSWLFVELTFRRTAVLLPYDLTLVWALQIARVGLVARHSGYDSNHIPYRQVPKDPYLLFVGPQYHAPRRSPEQLRIPHTTNRLRCACINQPEHDERHDIVRPRTSRDLGPT